MTRANVALMVMVVTVVGIWGCAQGPSGGSGSTSERLKALENKCAKLEDEAKANAATRDELRKKLAEAENGRSRAQRELETAQTTAKERTVERDALQGQFNELRKALRGLLTQADAAVGINSQPVTSAAQNATPSAF